MLASIFIISGLVALTVVIHYEMLRLLWRSRRQVRRRLTDAVYFSFTNYTALGYGDIEQGGQLRFLAGMEAITGLSLITWSASFMFMEMMKFWEE